MIPYLVGWIELLSLIYLDISHIERDITQISQNNRRSLQERKQMMKLNGLRDPCLDCFLRGDPISNSVHRLLSWSEKPENPEPT